MNSTGYGPSRESRWQRLTFTGDENDYELWEAKFLGHMRILKLKDTILPSDEEPNEAKNEECYAELIQLLDDKSLSLVMRDATDDGRKALKILREHYASQSKPRIITLYTELTSLEKGASETITEYLIRAERTITALRTAKETLSDGLTVAMILKGLPESYKPLAIHITQSTSEITFTEFKRQLRSFEETEKFNAKSKADQVMSVGFPTYPTCYRCRQKGHVIRDCPEKAEATKWCNFHKSTTHSDDECRRHQQRKDKTKQATFSDQSETTEGEHSFAFGIYDITTRRNNPKGLLVDTGATSHIVTTDTLKRVDGTFNPAEHSMELADGTKTKNIAVKRGDAEVILKDVNGKQVKTVLKDALYMPSYPQDIFSVKAATSNGAELKFHQGHSELVHKDGTTFTIEEHGQLYYLNTFEQCENSSDKVSVSHDIQTWHEILGHCNVEDIVKSQNVVDGMNISGKFDKTKLECNTCTEGKFVNNRNKGPDARATKPLEMVHTDLAGPIDPVSREGFKYSIAFTDDFSGAVFVYFLKNKSDTALATEKFLADCSPYGQVKCMRSDNGSEFMSNVFQTLLRERGIKHETSCPYSPHQNGTAERHWRTLFEMGRCLLIETELPKATWPYAIQTAAHIRNRCYNNRLENTPFFMLTGQKPDLSKMLVFGLECHTYQHNRKKLDSKCTKGVFVGYDKNSPAYLVYHPDSGKVMKHRLIKVIRKDSAEQQTQTDIPMEDLGLYRKPETEAETNGLSQNQASTENSIGNENNYQDERSETNQESEEQVRDNHGQTKRYPQRERKTPKYLEDFITDQNEADDSTSTSIDYCYRVREIPQTYTEAMNSPQTVKWKQAMKEEIESLEENDTFELTTLPEGKNVVGGKWVYTIKESAEGSETFKARYVAKGYSQVEGIDYQETFAPTASISSVRVLMQLAAQYDLEVHQMDVKTAYLHAPIDHEIFMDQPEGFERMSENGERMVYKLKKSLYGLKQSGRNWNKILHEHLIGDGFDRNPADHCVYSKQIDGDIVIVIVWVDDLIIASNNVDQMNHFKESMKHKFRMKDLGKISYFLGIDFDQTDGVIKMNQKRYITKMLDRFGMTNCKPRTTPCEQNWGGSGSELTDQKKYREIVGSLIYAMSCTRPDISWIVSKLSQKLSCPKVEDMVAAKHVLRYLKGTIDYELCFEKCDEDLNLIAYSDSDWASSLEDRRSTTGYCFSLSKGGPLISWKSRRQPTVALSTCEAEYIGLAATTQESLYLTQLLNNMGIGSYECTKMYGDNQGAIALSKNPVNRQRSKHIDIRHHFLRDVLLDGKIDIVYCPTENMVADIFTKPATKVKMNKFQRFLFGCQSSYYD